MINYSHWIILGVGPVMVLGGIAIALRADRGYIFFKPAPTQFEVKLKAYASETARRLFPTAHSSIEIECARQTRCNKRRPTLVSIPKPPPEDNGPPTVT